MRTITFISAALLLVTGCTSERVVSSNEWETVTLSSPAPAPSTPLLPPTNPEHMAASAGFAQQTDGRTGYYFTTPSGRWQCAILPGDKAGCEGTGGALNITGAPVTVTTADGAAARVPASP